MGLTTFLIKALGLSFNVMLRMFIMLAASFGLVFLLVGFMFEEPLGILVILGFTLFPGLVFLYLSCVRAGLVAIKASGPPNVKKLAFGTIKLFRFNIMLNNLIITLVGLGGSVLLMVLGTPEVWASFKHDMAVEDLSDFSLFIERLLQIPIGVMLIVVFALSISNGVMGTTTAAVAASCAEVGPNHHALWGATRQFFPLFVLSMIVLFIPMGWFVISQGGPLVPFSEIGELNIFLFLAGPVYLVWAGCAICGGKALAYAQTAQDLEDEWQKERDDMIGEVVPEDNLRALRLQRQKAGQLNVAGLRNVDVDDVDQEAVFNAPLQNLPPKGD